jgi:hypothetical protein
MPPMPTPASPSTPASMPDPASMPAPASRPAPADPAASDPYGNGRAPDPRDTSSQFASGPPTPPPGSWAGTGAPHPFADGEPRRSPSSWTRRNVVVAAAAAAAVVLVVFVGGFFVGQTLLSRNTAGGQAGPSASGTAGGAAGGAATSGAGANAAAPPTTAPASTTQDIIYRCPTNADAAYWGCLKSAKSVGSTLQLDYTTNFPLSTIQDASHYHFHVYLANAGPNGTTVPADSIMQHVPNAGSWFIIMDNKTKVIDNNTERGGGKAGIDTAKYKLLCVRVAVGLHDLAKDKKGGYRTGNCATITR